MLLAEACNIGLEPLIKHQMPALTRHRLNWVKQNYLRAETLVKASAKLVGYQSTLSLARKRGGGEVVNGNLELIQFFRYRQLKLDTPIYGVNNVADDFLRLHVLLLDGFVSGQQPGPALVAQAEAFSLNRRHMSVM